MDALLCTEHAVGVLAGYREHGAVEADDLARGSIVDRELPAAARGVGLVHAQEHLGPVLGLESSLAGRDRDDGVAVVELVGEPACKLELAQVVLEGGERCGSLFEKVLVAGLGAQLEGGLSVGKLGTRRLDSGDGLLGGGELGHHRARSVGVVPEARLGALLLELRDALASLIDMQVGLDLVESGGEGVDVGFLDVGH